MRGERWIYAGKFSTMKLYYKKEMIGCDRDDWQ